MRAILLAILAILGLIGTNQYFGADPEPSPVFQSAANFRNSTVLFIKPNCNRDVSDCSDPGAYQAGDVIMTMDGDELYKRFGDRAPFGVREMEEYIIATTTKLSKTEIDQSTEPVFAPRTAHEISRDLPTGELLKSRNRGIDLNNVLTQQELTRAESGKGTLEVKTIDKQAIEEKGARISATTFSETMVARSNVRRTAKKILAKIIKPAYAVTTVIKRVDPDNGTCDGAATDYTSLASWEAQDRNLVTSDNIEEVRICSTGGTADTTNVLIGAWTTSSTQYIDMKVVSTYRHDGKWNTSKARLSYTSAGTTAFDNRVNFIRMDGMQIETASCSSNASTMNSQSQTAGADHRISNTIIRGCPTGGFTGSGFNQSDPDTIIRMKNVVLYDHADSGSSRGLSIESNTGYYYNLTIFGFSTGIRHFSGTGTMINTVIASSSVSNFTDSGGTLTRTYTTGTDTSVGAGTGNDSSVTVASMNFTAAASTDFHINSSSSLYNDGTDLSGDSNYAFSDDIDYATRSGTWDKGVDEVADATVTPSSAPKVQIQGPIFINAPTYIP